MQLFNVFLDHLPQVHKRATECINAHNILQKIHSGDCPENLLTDNSILHKLKVFLVCLYVYFIVYMFVVYLVILILFLINKYSILFVWCDSLSQKCVQILIFWPQEGSLCHLYTCVPPDWEDPTPLAYYVKDSLNDSPDGPQKIRVIFLAVFSAGLFVCFCLELACTENRHCCGFCPLFC